jgi:hypothetical protein
MFGLFVCYMLLCLRYGSTIVTIEIHRTGRIGNNTQLRNRISDPKNFLCNFRSNNILSFRHRICYNILLGSFLAYRPSIETEHKTGLRFRFIHICLEASIVVTRYNELFFTSKHKEHLLRMFLTIIQ